MAFDVQPLSHDLLEDYLFFFDNIVFDENPDRFKCYCYDYHFLGDVESCTRQQSREAVSELIIENKLRGYLAFEDNVPVGWCNANNRMNYQRLLRDYDYVDNLEDKVCSIVCFLIHPNYRRRGIAHQLLSRVISDYSKLEIDYLEAYPKKGNHSCEGNFKGPFELYLQFEFKIHKEYDDYYIMRKFFLKSPLSK